MHDYVVSSNYTNCTYHVLSINRIEGSYGFSVPSRSLNTVFLTICIPLLIRGSVFHNEALVNERLNKVLSTRDRDYYDKRMVGIIYYGRGRF